MAIIPLTKGKAAIVDDEDFDWLNQWKWLCMGTGYAGRFIGPLKNRKLIFMHRLIMDTPDHLEVDHINWNKLDNRRSNLRNVTRSENLKNRAPWTRKGNVGNKLGSKPGPRKPGRSGIYGIHWERDRNKWVVVFKVDGKRCRFGRFTQKEDAERVCHEVREKLKI